MADTNTSSIAERIAEVQRNNKKKAEQERQRKKDEERKNVETTAQNYIDKLPGNFLELVLLLSEAEVFNMSRSIVPLKDLDLRVRGEINTRLKEKYPGIAWSVYAGGAIKWHTNYYTREDTSDAIIKAFKATDQIEGRDDTALLQKIKIAIEEFDIREQLYEAERKKKREEAEQRHAKAFAETLTDEYLDMIMELTEAGFNCYPLVEVTTQTSAMSAGCLQTLKQRYPDIKWEMNYVNYYYKTFVGAFCRVDFYFVHWGPTCGDSYAYDENGAMLSIMKKYGHAPQYITERNSCAVC